MSQIGIFDFVVVGAGIAGASVAWRLAQAGAAVLVLEREAQPGYHSTGRSAALFMESYGTQQIRALTRASRAFLASAPPGFCDHPLLHPRGVLYVGAAGQEALLEQALHLYRSEGLHAERLDTAQALALAPCLDASQVIGAVHDMDAMDIDVAELLQGFVRGLGRAGASLRCGAELAQAQRGADGLWSLALQDGAHYQARAVVNAAGAWADTLAQRCGVAPLGIQPKRRTAFTFAAPPDQDCKDWPMVIGVDESFYFKPDAGQLLGSPANADPVDAHDVVAEEWDVAVGIDRIQTLTQLRIRRPSHTWAGLRSFAPDGDLVLGWDGHCQGFFWLAGQGGYGIQTCAAVSELACALLLGQAVPGHLLAQGVQPEKLSPQRFMG